MRRKIFILVAIFIMNLLLPSCSVMNEPQEPSNNNENIFMNGNMDDVLDTGPVKGGILNLFSTAPDTLNPITTNNAYVKDYSRFIFESLVTINKAQEPVPLLAENWTVSYNGLEWTFFIRRGVNWHDSIPLSAEDVEFTINTIMDPSVNSHYKTNVRNISSVNIIDDYTIKITLNTPNSFTPEMMTFPIIPKHYFLGEDMLTSQKNYKPVGTGPYEFAEYRENEHIKFKNNDKWWAGKESVKKDKEWESQGKESRIESLPYIIEINIKIYGKDKSIDNAFQSKEVDLITMDREEWTRYSGRSDITLKKYPGNEYEFIAFNLSNNILKEKEVREAIAYSVDKLKLIDKFMPGEAVAADIPVIPDTWLYNTNVLSYTVNTSKARQILMDAGWKENKGVLYKNINGVYTTLKLEMLVNDDNDLRLKVAEQIKEQLAQTGIELNIKKVKWDDEFKRIKSRKFDMVFLGCTVTSIPDISFMYSSGQIGTGFNIAGYKNETVDDYFEKILSENDS
ncbi:MAG: peptide ABC transporter substrate-binding protein, partial [Clostridiaceae bacterium]|nr:peptide ABC transporter substrate-binding protein [Clostridiaceae bacterium]